MLYELNSDNPERSVKVVIKHPAHFGLHEEHIENFLKSRLSEIVSEEHLMLIGQERKGQEEADLLALDKEGTMYIFELKRWESNSENILQVMRYGQIFGRDTYEELQDLARRQQQLDHDLSLNESHRRHFDLDKPIKNSKFNLKQQFVLVTNGVDADTISAVDYWSGMGVEISCSPYRLYEIDGKPFIQFDTFNPDGDVLLETNTPHFIVNTNSSYMDTAWQDMLGDRREGKASAWGDRKWAICNIPQKSIVYLYHTGVGVIAKGMTTDSYQMTDYEQYVDNEYYVPLNFEWAIARCDWQQKAVKAWQINALLNAGHKFRNTVFTVSEEMAQAIDTIAEENNVPQG